ncbi:MAG: hypothetical protein M1834_007640 [Cirrosporium novae-zelandiae]|nr:MAG: hypothetical protein M1834_007640 [Cirrosporium novae-zelandiae]
MSQPCETAAEKLDKTNQEQQISTEQIDEFKATEKSALGTATNSTTNNPPNGTEYSNLKLLSPYSSTPVPPLPGPLSTRASAAPTSTPDSADEEAAQQILTNKYKPITDPGNFLALLANPKDLSTKDLYLVAENTQNALVEWQKEYEKLDQEIFKSGLEVKRRVNPAIHDIEKPFIFDPKKALESRRVGGRDLRQTKRATATQEPEAPTFPREQRARKVPRRFDSTPRSATPAIRRRKTREGTATSQAPSQGGEPAPKKRKGRPPGVKGRFWGAQWRAMKEAEEGAKAAVAGTVSEQETANEQTFGEGLPNEFSERPQYAEGGTVSAITANPPSLIAEHTFIAEIATQIKRPLQGALGSGTELDSKPLSS